MNDAVPAPAPETAPLVVVPQNVAAPRPVGPVPVVIPEGELPLHEALRAKVAEECGLSVKELADLARSVAVGGWAVGAFPPDGTSVARTHVVDSMFLGPGGDRVDDHVAGDVRVYCRPVALSVQVPTPDGPMPVPFFRFVVNRTPGTETRTDILTEEGFVEDVAFEYRAMFLDGDDEESSTCKCGSEVALGDKFCSDCGEPASRCGGCNRPIPVGDKFCSGCGLTLGETRDCPGCDATVGRDDKFCRECGMPAWRPKK